MYVRMFVLSALLITAQSVCASNYYSGINVGALTQGSKIAVVDNSLDPVIPNVTYPRNYVTPDESVAAYSFFVGYRLGLDVALEFGIVNTGDAESPLHAVDDNDPATDLFADETSEFKYNYLALVGVWPMGSNWSLNAKLGVASWQYDFRQQTSSYDTSVTPASLTPLSADSYSDNGSDFFYGLGLGYGLDQHLDIRAEISYIAFDPQFVNVNVEQKMTLFFVGAAYHF